VVAAQRLGELAGDLSHPGFGGDLGPRVSVWSEELSAMPAPKKYPDELREPAVRLMFESKRPIAHVALDLGVQKEALRSWVPAPQADAGGRQERLTSVERDELARLRGEVKQLRKANEILKAA